MEGSGGRGWGKFRVRRLVMSNIEEEGEGMGRKEGA